MNGEEGGAACGCWRAAGSQAAAGAARPIGIVPGWGACFAALEQGQDGCLLDFG
jgi:hypothetical protein